MYYLTVSLLLGIFSLNFVSTLADQCNVEKVVDQCKEANTELLARMDRLEKTVTNFHSTVLDMFGRLTCEGVFYRGKCYFASIRTGWVVSYEDSRDLCTGMGGKPADILNLEHQQLIAGLVRSKTPRVGDTYVWLGMTYTPSTSIMRWSNGTTVPDDVLAPMRWWDTYPRSPPSYVKMKMAVNTNTFGFYNHPVNHRDHGVVCEK